MVLLQSKLDDALMPTVSWIWQACAVDRQTGLLLIAISKAGHWCDPAWSRMDGFNIMEPMSSMQKGNQDIIMIADLDFADHIFRITHSWCVVIVRDTANS